MNRKRRFGLDGAAAVPEFHVIHVPNTLDARDNIELFAYHNFLVEVHPNDQAKFIFSIYRYIYKISI